MPPTGLEAGSSVNVETPTPELMSKLSKMKDLERDILTPMRWVDDLTRSDTGGAIGQATQLVVGAADESDWDIFKRIDQLYGEWNLKRVYYSAFNPVRHTPLEEHPPTPLIREHRLYQVDWLKRIYKFSNEELKLAFDHVGHLPLDSDPKTNIAVENLDAYPLDLNAAGRSELLRVPGIGPKSADRILRVRRRHRIDTWHDLKAMGVVHKRASPFVVFPGHRPPRAKQLRLDLFGEGGIKGQGSRAGKERGRRRGPVRPRSILRRLPYVRYARPPRLVGLRGRSRVLARRLAGSVSCGSVQ